MPPKPKKIDYGQLDKLCAIQCTGEECASILGMDYDTLNAALKRDGNKGFSDYFKTKSAFGKASLRRRQFKAAEDGNATMLVWLGKQWLGQLDRPSDAFENDNGNITKVKIEVIGASKDKGNTATS